MHDDYAISTLMAQLRSLHIESDRDAMFRDHLDRLLMRTPDGALTSHPKLFSKPSETRGIMVVGGAGAGKSRLIKQGLSDHPALQTDDPDKLLCLEASVPSPATMKSMAQHMLDLTGYPHISGRREAWSLWDTLRHRFKLLDTCILWIDEAHDLFCADQHLILRAVKSLMQGEQPVIVILSGTERLAEIVRSDQQVSRRLSTLELPRVSETADALTLRAIIEGYCSRAELIAPQTPDLVSRLVYAAHSHFGLCIEMTLNAIETALHEGADELEHYHYAEVWSLANGEGDTPNPFLIEDWANAVLPSRSYAAPSRRPPGRRTRA